MDWSPRSRPSNRCSRSPAPPEKGHRRAEIRCRLAEIRCRNPVSAHHSCPQGKSGVREIRCQFIILARKDEPTPDYARKDEPTPDYARKDEPTPDYARKDEPTPDYLLGSDRFRIIS